MGSIRRAASPSAPSGNRTLKVTSRPVIRLPAIVLGLVAPGLDGERLGLGPAVGDVVDVGGGAGGQRRQQQLDGAEVGAVTALAELEGATADVARPEPGEADPLDGHRAQRVVGHRPSLVRHGGCGLANSMTGNPGCGGRRLRRPGRGR